MTNSRYPYYRVLGDPSHEEMDSPDWKTRLIESRTIFEKRPIRLETHRDADGREREYYVVVGPEVTSYYIPVDSNAGTPLPSLDLTRDYYFMLGNRYMALIHETPDGPQEYLLQLYDHESLPLSFMFIQDWTREEALRILTSREAASPRDRHDQKMMYEAPRDTYHTAGVHTWKPDLLYPQLYSESDAHYSQRLEGVVKPSEALAIADEIYAKTGIRLYSSENPRSIDAEPMLLFLTAYKNFTEQEKGAALKILSYEGDYVLLPLDFVNLFAACELDAQSGQLLTHIAQRDDFEDVFYALFKIFFWRKDIAKKDIWGEVHRRAARTLSAPLSPKDIEKTTQDQRRAAVDRQLAMSDQMAQLDPLFNYTYIAKKAKRFLEDAARGMSSEELEKLYSPDTLIQGAVINGIVQKNDKSHTVNASLETFFDDVTVHTPFGGPTLVDAHANEINENMFLHPEQFSFDDYNEIVACLHAAYDNTDPEWCAYLIRGLERDLKNPTTQFVLFKKEQKLLGVCKIRPATQEERGDIKDDVMYFGTHYATKHAPKHFNIGEIVQTVAQTMAGENTKFVLTVSATNPNLERQIGTHGAGVDVTVEGDAQSHSKELIKAVWNDTRLYRTQNKEQYPDAYFKSVASPRGSEISLQNEAHAFVYSANSADSENSDFLQLCRSRFSEGYRMTRIFYDRTKDGKADLTKTYVVFE